MSFGRGCCSPCRLCALDFVSSGKFVCRRGKYLKMALRKKKNKAEILESGSLIDASSGGAENEKLPVFPETLSDGAQKSVLNRLSRVVGHLQSIKRMVEEGREIETMLIQISAVKAAVNGVGKEMLNELASVRGRNRSLDLSPSDVDDILVLVNRYLK